MTVLVVDAVVVAAAVDYAAAETLLTETETVDVVVADGRASVANATLDWSTA